MYDKEQMIKAAHYGNAIQRIDENPTVEENIDRRIRMVELELQRLKESKETLGPLLKMRIRDIQNAMNY
jgi:hypothetical protein